MPTPVRRGSSGHIFLPQYNYKATWKVTIDGTDVTADVISLNISKKLANLDTCQITLTNPSGKYVNTYNGGEEVIVYAEYDYVVNPTNKIFKGKLDNIYFSYGSDGYKASIDCRQLPELNDIKIVEQYDNALISDIIKDIVDKYYSTLVTYTNVTTTSNRATINFKHDSGIKAFEDLANQAEMNLYIDTNDDIHLFTPGTVINDDEEVSLENNLISVPKYGKDTTKIFNRIIVYGKEDQNILLINTQDDTASQADLWIKELVVSDNKLGTMEETQNKAQTELTNNTNVEEDGRINVLGMIYVNPGDYISASVPYCGIDGYQTVAGISHTFDMSGFLTGLEIEDKQDTLDILFRERIDAEERLKPYSNLNNMSDTYTIFFTESPVKWTLSNCEVVANRLQLSAGQTSGVCTFNTVTADSNITKCELRVVVNFPEDADTSYDVSNDDGTTWESVTPGIVHYFSSTGSQLKFRINLVSVSGSNPTFEKVCLLYR